MQYRLCVLTIYLILFLSACTETGNDLSQLPATQEPQLTPSVTVDVSENLQTTPTPTAKILETEPLDVSGQTLVNIDDLPSGQYIVSMSIAEDQLNIWNIHGEKLGTFLPFSLNGKIDPSYSLLAYESSVYTSSALHLFGSDFALYDLDSNTVLPVNMPNVEWGKGFPGSWSPDGKFIIINTLNEGISPRLGLVTVSGLLFEDIELWDDEASDPEWSPDGKNIAFNSHYYSENYYLSSIFLLDTSCLSELSSCVENVNRIFSDEEYSYDSLSWAPDSIHLVLSCSGVGEHSTNLCIGNIHTGEVTRIENTETINYNPEWSPNGEWISASAEGSIHIIRPDGSEARLIVENEHFLFWIYIPDSD